MKDFRGTLPRDEFGSLEGGERDGGDGLGFAVVESIGDGKRSLRKSEGGEALVAVGVGDGFGDVLSGTTTWRARFVEASTGDGSSDGVLERMTVV